jgi:drug/metabolite transporter (DMT)-like permease
MQATESDLAIVFYSNVFGAVLASVPAAWHWEAVEGSQAVLLLGAGVLGVLSQACMVKAYRAADPATLAPVEYLQIPFTVVLAAVLFGELPHPWTGAGIALIVIAGWQASRSLVSRHA